MRWARRVAHNCGEHTSVLVDEAEGKRPVGKPRRRWENNIKKDNKEIRLWGAGRIDLTQDRDKCWGSCERGNENSGSIKSWEFLDQLRKYQLLKMTVLHAICLTTVSVYFWNVIFMLIIDRKDFRLIIFCFCVTVMCLAVLLSEGHNTQLLCTLS